MCFLTLQIRICLKLHISLSIVLLFSWLALNRQFSAYGHIISNILYRPYGRVEFFQTLPFYFCPACCAGTSRKSHTGTPITQSISRPRNCWRSVPRSSEKHYVDVILICMCGCIVLISNHLCGWYYAHFFLHNPDLDLQIIVNSYGATKHKKGQLEYLVYFNLSYIGFPSFSWYYVINKILKIYIYI